MPDLGYGKGYAYPHDDPEALADAVYLPDDLSGTIYYEPTDRGFEATIKARLDKWRKILAARRGNQG
jgi:putative ATPase